MSNNRVVLEQYQIDYLIKQVLYQMYREDKISLEECCKQTNKIDQGGVMVLRSKMIIGLLTILVLFAMASASFP